MPAMMRAIRQHEFGGPEVLRLEEVERPEPLWTEVLIRVHAAGVNPVDCKTRAGGGISDSQGKLPITIGWDVSGVVEAVGSGVTRFAPGDEVYGMVNFPRVGEAYAEYVAADSRQLARKPANISHVEAAAIPLVSLTAWQSLVSVGGVGPGKRVLVHGAGGGLGHLAVQIARARGASYIYGTGLESQADILRGCGLDELIDYTKQSFEEIAHDVDIVVDTVAGDNGLRSVKVMRPGGALISLPVPPSEATLQEAERRGVRAVSLTVEGDRADLEAITALVEAGALRPHVGDVLPLERADQAHEIVESGRSRGKVVLRVVEGE
ncbi:MULTISPECIES: NADP-dependent oxidoreductase [Streptomyces]|uniref:NADP-dependent oxidoreductase n=1 Tax=Streptomyces TaxID=1883 RepID=UPI0019A9E8F1|nr:MULTISPECIES: NADP-dependent oxidoreductase [Streptomyces]GGR95427.1 NADPH:quinone reductase [Streptomyces eurythermus]